MEPMNKVYPITGDDLWVKIVGMLQQNWASIEDTANGVAVYFANDGSYVFDEIPFASVADARAALVKNGFKRLRDSPDLQMAIDADPPKPPFTEGNHPSGRIYSSGRYWK